MTTPNPTPPRDLAADTWTATDALGRRLPAIAECGPPRPGRFVGMFYFVWLGWHDLELHDLTKIVAANPEAPEYGPVNMFHWWGEPRFGYYRGDDRWVIRKHAQMLINAGVDVIILDVTNTFTYDPTVTALCEEYTALRSGGQPTPQIAFLTNSGSAKVVQHLYETIYAPGRFRDLWFDWKGKPLLLSTTDGIDDPAILDFFTFRRSWAWTEGQEWFGDGQDKWPWLDHHPQNPGWHESPDRPEQIAVCVAQHPISNIGRSFHNGVEPPREAETPFVGLCFQEQWDRALAVDPEFVLVTGWNEWVAQRFLKQPNVAPNEMARKPLQPGDSFFVDQYSLEFSRDIEPMRGGYNDSYYCQLTANIRRYKGVRPLPKPSPTTTTIPAVTSNFTAWAEVQPTYLNNLGEGARNHPGWGNHHYNKPAPRNEFDTLKIARDTANVYFYARTTAPIRLLPRERPMLLLIATGASEQKDRGWEGFNFLVRIDETAATLHQHAGEAWNWTAITTLPFSLNENELHLSLPRNLIAGDGKLQIDFQWADDIPEPADILDFIDHGNAAPPARFHYRFQE